ncbi:SDR family NAD(P)-dependent oxidoreductase [Leucobacter aridicollis]|uniref:SDR family NAD(P)-dependent oxidoreductase n=1 Tax=Leucobacter aridicollis TaxID=283878 RepID=UPI000E648089|nr:SDR family oxidoreductase [Leucobacter aridicollis]UTX54044.1 SDR family oxidoreductase [Leucobacter aridicollis]
MNRLSKKSCIVFGGGSVGGEINNGLAAAITYAREGASVTIVDLSAEAVEGGTRRVREECATLGLSPSVLGIVGDVTDESSIENAVAETIAEFGAIDVLHNNVGVARMGGPIEQSVEDWKFSIDVNLTSIFLTCKHVLPHMLAQGGGSIINIGSVGGMRYIGYNYPSYSATKGAVAQFTQNLALEYASRGIRANTIAPGYINTPMIYRQISSAYDSVEAMVAARDALSPTGKMGDSFDVANAALFLASDEARYVNGVCLPVDGGLVQSSAPPAVQQ